MLIMTNKQILAMITNEDIIYYSEKIKFENDNLCCKTELEEKAAKKRINEYVHKIKEILKEC
jgi:hypothetical protein